MLVAFDARRPRVDLDSLAGRVEGDEVNIAAMVAEIAGLAGAEDDGVVFGTETIRSRSIRDEAVYAGGAHGVGLRDRDGAL